MTWQSLPMTGDCTYHYEEVRKFTLVKESPNGLRIRLEDHPEKISIWMPKKELEVILALPPGSGLQLYITMYGKKNKD